MSDRHAHQHDPLQEMQLRLTRRSLLANGQRAIGAAALTSLMFPNLGSAATAAAKQGGPAGLPHFAPKAKRAIFLFMSGGPSHMETFDFHPEIRKLHGQDLPASVMGDQRIPGFGDSRKTYPIAAPMFEFQRHGERGTWVSELLPHTAAIVDDLTIVKSVHTESVTHDPAITYFNTCSQRPGKPSLGAWLSYGLGTPNDNLPAYVVMISRGKGSQQALFDRLWGAGFLSSRHQGVRLRGGNDPVLFLKDPAGIDRDMRRWMLDRMARINNLHFDDFGDPETQARIAQFEMAFRMQASVPELSDLSDEPESVFKLYGSDSKKPGTFARNCIVARRLAERGVRFQQLFHRGWDQHSNLPSQLRGQCLDVDQAAAGLVTDLKQRGLLDETLVIWGGEFGRTIFTQASKKKDNIGRDHHGGCFTIWMAGGGVKAGMEYGRTDDFCFNIVENPVHIRDVNATILHQLGIDHNRLTFHHQGLDQTPTGVEPSRVVKEILA